MVSTRRTPVDCGDLNEGSDSAACLTPDGPESPQTAAAAEDAPLWSLPGPKWYAISSSGDFVLQAYEASGLGKLILASHLPSKSVVQLHSPRIKLPNFKTYPASYVNICRAQDQDVLQIQDILAFVSCFHSHS